MKLDATPMRSATTSAGTNQELDRWTTASLEEGAFNRMDFKQMHFFVELSISLGDCCSAFAGRDELGARR